MTKIVDTVGRLVAVTTGGSPGGSIVQQLAFAESKNPLFALFQGALTVRELGTSSTSTTPPNTSDPASVQANNSVIGGWAIWGCKITSAPAFQTLRVKIDKPPISKDPFDFGP